MVSCSINPIRKFITRFSILINLLLLQLSFAYSQDTLVLKNGNFIDGEIKDMEQNLLRINADYGDKDFIIEWDEIREIYTSTYFFVYLADGDLQYGWLRSTSDTTLNIVSSSGEIQSHPINEILKLRGINQGFRNRFNAGFDVGFGLAKANNLRRLTINGNAGYKAEKWHGKAFISTHNSIQDKTEQIKRYEGDLHFRYLFYKDWALDPAMNFLSNTEQKLALRSSLRLGIGKYIIHKSRGHWGIGAGINRNIEQFSNETPDRNSWEGYGGTEVDLYGLNDLEIFSKLMAYPSFTQSGRWRADFNFNIKYKLPLDFYIKLDCTMNYDNQPAIEASDMDYVVQLGFGWSW